MTGASSAPAIALRDRLIVYSCIALVTAVAWAYLIHVDREMAAAMDYDQMMADMGMGDAPWTIIDGLLTFLMWLVMMIGMMAPSAAPMLALFAATQRGREPRSSLRLLLFAAGYLLVWMLFSALAAGAQWILHDAALLSPMMKLVSVRAGAVVLIAAGIYQLTPLKEACLTHCRSPLGFIMSHWRDGARGAIAMGTRHGVYCLGCCWAAMCLLFVFGIMNLLWVALLSILVLIEKVMPGGVVLARAGGVAMIAAGALHLLVA